MAKAKTRGAYIGAIVQLLTDWEFNRALQAAMCGCHPLRPRQEALDLQIKEKIADMKKDVQALVGEPAMRYVNNEVLSLGVAHRFPALTKKRNDLTKEIQTIDQRDHPRADKMEKTAKIFARVWVIEQVDAGVTLPMDKNELQKMYATAIAKGWKPKP